MCGEWEARLERAESQVVVEKERCTELGEQLNNQLAREIALEATLADVRERCLKAEHVGEVLAKEAELGATKLDSRLNEAFGNAADLEAVVRSLESVMRGRLEEHVLRERSLRDRVAQQQEAEREQTVNAAELERTLVEQQQQLEQADKVKDEMLQQQKLDRERERNLQDQLAAAQRGSENLAAAYDGVQDELSALQDECAGLSARASELEKELAQERQQEDAMRKKMALAETNCQRLREMIKEETDVSHALRQELNAARDQEKKADDARFARLDEVLAAEREQRLQLASSLRVEKEQLLRAQQTLHQREEDVAMQQKKDLEQWSHTEETLRQRATVAENTCQQLREALEEETGVAHALRETSSKQSSSLLLEITALKEEVASLSGAAVKSEGALEVLKAHMEKEAKVEIRRERERERALMSTLCCASM